MGMFCLERTGDGFEEKQGKEGDEEEKRYRKNKNDIYNNGHGTDAVMDVVKSNGVEAVDKGSKIIHDEI